MTPLPHGGCRRPGAGFPLLTPALPRAIEAAPLPGTGGPTARTAESLIFVSDTRRRVRAVNAAAGLLAASIVMWLVALLGGATDFVQLPALRTSAAGLPSSLRRAARPRAPAAVKATAIQASVVLPAKRHRVRGGVRS